MRVLIVTYYPFPYGMAQTNRLIAMAKGLVYAGADVEVLVTKATESGEPKNKESKGNYQGIRFTYVTGTTIRPGGTFRRALLFLRGALRTITYIRKEHRRKSVDVIFMGVHSNWMTYSIYLLTRVLGAFFVQERSEFPFLSCSGSLTGRASLGIYLKLICRRFDGFIVISHALKNYFSPYLNKNVKEFLLPIIVETERFGPRTDPPGNIITYCGSMQGSKDGVPVLIESFSEIAGKFPGIKLRLVGSTAFPGFGELENRIKDLHLEDRIIFTGIVDRDKMPEILQESRVLALARPNSKQAEGGFPTKLGEYLAAGRVVVVTSVGDIPRYLVHGKHALLADPGSVEDFAKKLSEALTGGPAMEKIASQGRKLAEEVFSYEVQGERLFLWLQSNMKK